MATRKALTVMLLLGLISACGPSAAQLQATQDVQNTQVAATQAEIDARATSVQGTQDAANREATSVAATATGNAEATVAAKATQSQAAADAARLATQAASPMADLVSQLRTDGLVTADGGFYTLLPPFDESWAQLGWYQVTPLPMDPTDFVIQVSAAWDSGSRTANWFGSGCGIVFRYQDIDNHYVAFLTLDGNVTLVRAKNGVIAALGTRYFGQVDTPAGNASMTVIGEGSHFVVLVNDKKVIERDDAGLTSGMLGYTILSGTNKDFGTRCQLNNVGLWTLK